jgi:hypothetical protein
MTRTPQKTIKARRKSVAKKATEAPTAPVAAKKILPPDVDKRTSAPSPVPQRAGPWTGVGAVLIVFSIVVSGAVVSWDVWWPYVEPSLPQTTAQEDPRLANLMDRLGVLEEKIQTTDTGTDQPVATFEELDRASEVLSAELATVIQRLETVEKSIKDVERLALAVGSSGGTDDAKQSLRALAERINTIQQSTESGTIVGQLDSLEQQTRAAEKSLSHEMKLIEDVKRRIDGLEAERLGAETGLTSRASALILSIGQLRDAVRQERTFTAELNSVIAIAPDDLNTGSTIAVLRVHAETGVTTLTGLRSSFAGVANAVLQADRRMEGDGWLSKAVNQLSSLVTIRRVDGAAPAGSTDADIGRAEANLAVGDLAAAIDVLEGLSGPGAGAAQSWLAQARATAAVQQALMQLNSIAITQLSAAQG